MFRIAQRRSMLKRMSTTLRNKEESGSGEVFSIPLRYSYCFPHLDFPESPAESTEESDRLVSYVNHPAQVTQEYALPGEQVYPEVEYGDRVREYQISIWFLADR